MRITNAKNAKEIIKINQEILKDYKQQQSNHQDSANKIKQDNLDDGNRCFILPE